MIEVNSLWIGQRYSSLERLCALSHLANGHRYNLWCYETLPNVPDGVTIKDGREILPESEIFRYKVGLGRGSVSAFSNFFRYKLLLERGGWWVDSDVVCLKPFGFEQSVVIASENDLEGNPVPATCVMKAPAGSEVMSYCWDKCRSYDKETLEWSVAGPKLLQAAVAATKMNDWIVPSVTFCPIDWSNWLEVFEPRDVVGSHGLHLWNEMWRRNWVSKEKTFRSDSLFESLKRRYLC